MKWFEPKIKYVIRKRQIGDVLWFEPVIRALASKNRKVYVHTRFNTLFENYPLENVVFRNKMSIWAKIGTRIENMLGTSKVFINLDNSYEIAPEQHILNAYQKKADLPVLPEYPRLYLNENELGRRVVKAKRYVVLHIESFSDKNYRKVFNVDWNSVVHYLGGQGYEVVLVGKEPEKISGAISLKTSLRELMSVINQASFFIGIDSGPSHIAAALGRPSLIFFGAINPYFRHFPTLFKGFFMQQFCEFGGCYHKIATPGVQQICRLVGDNGIPKCSAHSTEFVIQNINLLQTKYGV